MITRTLFTIAFLAGALTSSSAQTNSIGGAETAYIHCDKIFYQAGDIIWFKLYLAGQPHIPSDLSVVAYVELLNANEIVLSRLRLKCMDGITYGQIVLPSTLSTGIYTLKPYTLWMKNFYPEDAFSTQILIYNVNDPTDPFPLIASLNQQIPVNEQPTTISRIAVETNKTNYGPRERIDVTVSLLGENKKPMSGNFSITVRAFDDSLIHLASAVPNTLEKSSLGDGNTPNYPKERLIYPYSTSSLSPIEDYTVSHVSPGTINTSLYAFYPKQALIDAIQSSYTSPETIEYSYLKLPADISYYPGDYERLESMSDFLKEIVPQIKVFKGKRAGDIRIRNTENSQRVFLFEKSPLIIVDGFIVENSYDILTLDPAHVSSIDVAWSMHSINYSAVSSLADNGIVAVYTKNGAGEKMGLKKLYDGFHMPAVFKVTEYKRKYGTLDQPPDFRNPLYWNNSFQVSVGSRFSFFTSDESGSFIIEITGMTDEGKVLTGRKVITVDF
jgi:hypothetical protein